MMVFLKAIFEKVDFEKKSREQTSMQNYSVGKELSSKDPDQPGHQPSQTGFYSLVSMGNTEAQRLSGRDLDSESRGCG